MTTSDLSEPAKDGEAFDGFFFKPVFRSGYFIVASLVCFGAVAYDIFVMCRHWRILSSNDVFAFFLVASLLLGFWTFSLGQHSWVRVVYANEMNPDVRRSFLVNNVLQAAAKTINEMLFSGPLAVLLLLFFVDSLLSRIPAK